MPRERKGTLVWRKKGWCARVTATVDGEPVKQTHELGTHNRPAAKRKLARLIEQLAAEAHVQDPASEETLMEYEAAWHARRVAAGVTMARDEHAYLTKYVLPELGPKGLSEVKPADVRGVLESVVGLGFKQQTIRHIRAALYRLLESAWQDELIAENPVKRVPVPRVKGTKKERCILTDAELAAYLESGDARDLEVKLLGLVARVEGGMRTSDLHRWDWSMVDRVHFAACTILRSKTDETQALAMPPVVGEALRLHWKLAGRPVTGPVFPARRGARAGQQKAMRGNSYAKRLRRDLLRAGVKRHSCKRAPDAPPRKRDEKCCPNFDHDPLYVETATTLPVDFHSFRRAFSTALAASGTNAQLAMKLAHHADERTHMRYVLDTPAMRQIPEAAVPKVALPKPPEKTRSVSKRAALKELTAARHTRFELVTFGSGGQGTAETPAFVGGPAGPDEHKRPEMSPPRLFAASFQRTWLAVLAELGPDLVHAALVLPEGALDALASVG